MDANTAPRPEPARTASGLTPRELEIVDALQAAAEAYLRRNNTPGYAAMRAARRIVVMGLTRLDLDLREPRDWEITRA